MEKAEFVQNLVGAVMDLVAVRPKPKKNQKKNQKVIFARVVAAAQARGVLIGSGSTDNAIIVAVKTLYLMEMDNQAGAVVAEYSLRLISEAWDYYEAQLKPGTVPHR